MTDTAGATGSSATSQPSHGVGAGWEPRCSVTVRSAPGLDPHRALVEQWGLPYASRASSASP
jgi:hypothetical protein